MNKKQIKKSVIIGAGPAGLTAAEQLLKTHNFSVDILEKYSMVGGLSKTTTYKGCKFDIGPHHFLTESTDIEKYWKDLMLTEEALGNPFVHKRRFTRIYYKKHFFNYPLQPMNVFRGLSLFECVRCVLSYIKIRLFPIKNVKSFQDWVTNKFGYRLFSIFFKTYTEKLWGISCQKISSDWAAQRIKGFSLSKAIFYAFFGRCFKKNAPRTLADEFYYPLLGAGTLWERLAINIRSNPEAQIHLDEKVVEIRHENFKIKSVLASNASDPNNLKEYSGDFFFSTMPLKSLITCMNPAPEEKIILAAEKLCYRGLILVNLIVDKKNICPDHWLYIHEKDVKVVRIDNMNNFSLCMVEHEQHTALSLEYFAFADSAFWQKSDDEFIELGKKEVVKIGLVKTKEILDGVVVREAEAYPVYDEHYKKHLHPVLDYLAHFSNLQLIGRNGVHRYNNMDSAMLSAMNASQHVIEQANLELLASETLVNKKEMQESIF
jgi:protoporphyrinogen oxidase